MNKVLGLKNFLVKLFKITIIRSFSFLYSRSLPLPERVLIVSPHPDDETIGCAGLIQKLISEGKDVHVVMLTGGEGAYDASLIDLAALVAKRRELTGNAAKIAGPALDKFVFFDWGDGKLREALANESRQKELLAVINGISPAAIFVPHITEGRPDEDHVCAAKTVLKVVKEHGLPINVFFYCVWLWQLLPFGKIGSLNWTRSYVLSMTKRQQKIKKEAVDAYVKPLTSFGKPYSGVLPRALIYAGKRRKELYFEAGDAEFGQAGAEQKK